MAGIVLNVEVRDRTGTGGARASRRDGKVPGVLYGGGKDPVAIDLKAAEVVKAINAGKFISHLVQIEHKGEKQPVIPREVQFHPVTDQPLHVDLYRVDEHSVIDVKVPLHFINQEASPGLKRGAVLNVPNHFVQLRVPADKIPERIDIDLTGVDIGQAIHISQVKLPDGVSPKNRKIDFTVATLAGRLKEEAPAAEAAPAADAKAAGGKAAPAAKQPAKK